MLSPSQYLFCAELNSDLSKFTEKKKKDHARITQCFLHVQLTTLAILYYIFAVKMKAHLLFVTMW